MVHSGLEYTMERSARVRTFPSRCSVNFTLLCFILSVPMPKQCVMSAFSVMTNHRLSGVLHNIKHTPSNEHLCGFKISFLQKYPIPCSYISILFQILIKYEAQPKAKVKIV